jgi:hypothetical protein
MKGKKHKPIEFIVDPSSGELSASRLLLLVLILAYFPAMMIFEALGIKMGFWTQFAAIVGSVAGAYGVNSAARVWRSSYQEEIQSSGYTPPGPHPPRAKPAPPQEKI